MSYSLLILRPAARQLAALPLESYTELRDRIRGLGDDPLPPGAEKLDGREGWRLYVGSHRLIYKVDRMAGSVTVLDVARRSTA
ncbi:MAG TPA: type II toxin-antitoxin system RelE/ParE family toxin [Terriglobia bacterium]|nr:type II toxin-antitoxin system RelE/ParE family toxin [Terriglobia bacterium]